ncbi:hypothetical protein SUGI_0796320 [Cryptomeria japonica]|nr:hypothetical protein SUGI_0796320 [Cryptomeria japonica]
MGRKFLEDEKTGHLGSSPISSPKASLEVAEPSSFDGTLIIILAGFVVSLLCAMAVSRLVRFACGWIGGMIGVNLSPVSATAQTGNWNPEAQTVQFAWQSLWKGKS